MRKSCLAMVFCLLFIFVGTSAYSASAHRSRGGENVKKTVKKQQAKASRLAGKAGIKASDSRKDRRVSWRPGDKRLSKKGFVRNGAVKRRVPMRQIEVVEKEQDPEFLEYRVQTGDTVETLAARFDVDGQDIVDLNGLKRGRLTPGTKLIIPRETSETASFDEPVTLRKAGPLKAWKNEEERGFLVKVARSFSGAPYKYGGDSVRGIDCSAFVRKMYEIFDVQLPRTAREQFHAGMKVDKDSLVTGDLVFFRTRRSADYPTHVGIYIGDGKFIHASSLMKRGVKVDSLNQGYFDRTYTGAVRVKTLDKDRS